MSAPAKTPISYLPRVVSVPDFETRKVASHVPETQRDYLQARSYNSLPHANCMMRPGEGLFPTSNETCKEERKNEKRSYGCCFWFLLPCWRKLKSRKIPEPSVQPIANDFYTYRRHTTKSFSSSHKIEINSINKLSLSLSSQVGKNFPPLSIKKKLPTQELFFFLGNEARLGRRTRW